MKYDYTYDKNSANYEEEYELIFDGDYITNVLLKEENLALRINPIGEVALCDKKGEVIDTKEVKSEKYPDKKFTAVLVRTTDDEVVVKMLVLKYKDNYPHCDGEYDRWTVTSIDSIPVTFSLA